MSVIQVSHLMHTSCGCPAACMSRLAYFFITCNLYPVCVSTGWVEGQAWQPYNQKMKQLVLMIITTPKQSLCMHRHIEPHTYNEPLGCLLQTL